MIGRRGLKPRKLVREHRKRLLTRAKGAGASFALAIILLAVATHVPHIDIEEVSVLGAETVSEREILATAEQKISGRYGFLFSKSNIALFPAGSIEKTILKSMARVKEVNVSRTGLSSVAVSVSERKPYAVWCGRSLDLKEGCLFLDKDGVLFTEAPTFTGNVYFQYYGPTELEPIGTQFLSKREFAKLDSFRHDLTKISVDAVAMTIIDDNDAEILTSKGNAIYFKIEDDNLVLLENLDSVLRSDAFDASGSVDYIDLRFGNKVYFKPI